MNNKIEENRYFEVPNVPIHEVLAITKDGTKYQLKEVKLSTLIQEERKKAKEEYIKVVWNEVCEKIKEDSVREFVKYMEKRKMSNFYIDELLEEYLESEGK